MSRSVYLSMFLLGLLAVSVVAVFQNSPGYMDAEYYYAGGVRLHEGFGFSEKILWNYLDDPTGLPHPSHGYWMPLASLLAALGMKLVGSGTFSAARLPFLLVAACLPPLSAYLGFAFTQRRESGILAGILTAFSPFYLSYLGTTDNFGVYMLLGGLWLVVAGQTRPKQNPLRRLGSLPFDIQPAALGFLAGWMHLARADGLIWLAMSLAAALFPPLALSEYEAVNVQRFTGWRSRSVRVLLVLAGYLLVMTWWFYRNLGAFGTPLAPGGAKALWLTNYNELYSYPAALLTPTRWLASGLGEITRARVEALGQNLASAFAVQGSIFLAPLILGGLWRLRADRRVRLGLLGWLLTLLAMTFLFPYQGWRGGFFHSGAAVQLLFWAVAPVGLDGFIAWGVRRRKWIPGQASAFFNSGAVGLAVLLAALVVQGRVVGKNPAEPAWDQGAAASIRFGRVLQQAGISPEAVIAVNNPAGFFAHTGRPAIAIPNGEEDTLLVAAQRYKAQWVILEANHPPGLDSLYQQPEGALGLELVKTIGDSYLFEVRDVP